MTTNPPSATGDGLAAELNAIQLLDHTGPRMETGAVQFGDDWPGVFIRGDNAAFMAMNLLALLSGKEEHPFTRGIVSGLVELLLCSQVSDDLRERARAELAALSPPSAPGDVGALVERLLRTEQKTLTYCSMDRSGTYAQVLVNPDGPEAAAALSASAAEIEALRGAARAITLTDDDVSHIVYNINRKRRDTDELSEFDVRDVFDNLRLQGVFSRPFLTSPDGGRNG